jgi:beta-mannosidase
LLKKYNPKETVLLARLTNDEGVLAENNCYFAKVKELNLPRPAISYEITKTGSAYAIPLSTDALAKNVYIETANEGFLSDNFFDLYPNRPVTVTFDGDETPEITRVYSLAESIADLTEK